MKRLHSPMQALRAPHLLAAVLAAITVAGSLVCTLLLAFHSASPTLWLTATPEVMEMVAHCDSLAARQARERCVQQRVAARLAPEPAATRLARR